MSPTTPPPSRIVAARSRAAAAKQMLAAAALGLFGFLVLFLRSSDAGHASTINTQPASASTQTSAAASSLGGGSIAPAQSSVPQAQTATS
jgi:hypothetical protein